MNKKASDFSAWPDLGEQPRYFNRENRLSSLYLFTLAACQTNKNVFSLNPQNERTCKLMPVDYTDRIFFSTTFFRKRSGEKRGLKTKKVGDGSETIGDGREANSDSKENQVNFIQT